MRNLESYQLAPKVKPPLAVVIDMHNSKVSSGSEKNVKKKNPDKPDSKRRREDTISSSSGDNTSGASMLVDPDTITVKHDDLKSLIDSAVKDAISAAMMVASTRLEASLKNIFTDRFDQLEGRVFDVEQAIDNDLKKVNEAVEQHKSSTARSLGDCDTRIFNNERYTYQNECDIEDLRFELNNPEQYTQSEFMVCESREEAVMVRTRTT